MEDLTCNDGNPRPDDSLSVEARLVKYLRLWAIDPNAVTDSSALTRENRPIQEELRLLLEWYICECLQYGALKHWWSDGVMHPEIRQTAPNAFKLLVVTWIGCDGIAPFEIDVELDPARNDRFAKTVFRIGTLDEERHPRISDRGNDVRRLIERRPRENADWAMAVELTPPSV